ncbi:choline transporter-like 2 [Pararge aegeria]|nr:choline transporter-like 2 [Pararge aegeria]
MQSDCEKRISTRPDINTNRSCTDIFGLILFIIFLGGWGYLGYYSMTKGNIYMLVSPINSKNKFCGKDPGLENKKYLNYLDVTECLSSDFLTSVLGCGTSTVCVEECPEKTVFLETILKKSPEKFDELKSAMVCREDIKIQTLNAQQALEHMDKDTCAKYVLHSKPVLGRCFPIVVNQGKEDNNTKTSQHSQQALIDVLIIHTFVHQYLHLLLASTVMYSSSILLSVQIVTNIIADLQQSKWYMTAALLCMVALCFTYIFLLKWVIKPLVWITISSLFIVLAVGMYLCYTNFEYYKEHPKENNQIIKMFGLGPTYKIWRAILIALSIVFAILLLVILFLRSRIVIAIALIREGSKAVTAIKSTVFLPIFPLMVQCLVVAYTVLIFVALVTIEDSEIQSGLVYLKLANLFGFYWTRAFVSGVTDMIFACTFSMWYWTLNKKDLPFFSLTSGIHKTFRYHLGTVAVGSLIISIVQIIKFIVNQLSKKTNIGKFIPKWTTCLCKCFFDYVEKALKFINKNAYIMCAIRGDNFFKSASHAFSLLMRNIVRVVVLDKVVDFVFLLSKLLMSIGVGFAVYYLLEWDYLYEHTKVERLNYNSVPALVLGIATYLVCTIFFDVYAMAIDTLFLCFLEDCERNDGSPEKPYYMSKNLMKILGKKNKTGKPEKTS